MVLLGSGGIYPTKKLVGVIRKYHNHKLQTNPWHREEELQYIYSNKTPKMQ